MYTVRRQFITYDAGLAKLINSKTLAYLNTQINVLVSAKKMMREMIVVTPNRII
jgi:hypothetical protein